MKKTQGLTLIELLIAVAVVTIISAVAYPSYQAMVEKSRRTEARALLSSVQLAQERYFTINGRYATNFTELTGNFTDSTMDYGSSSSSSTLVSRESIYNITLSGASNTAYTAIANAVGIQAGDTDCAMLSISHLGVKNATNTAKCW